MITMEAKEENYFLITMSMTYNSIKKAIVAET